MDSQRSSMLVDSCSPSQARVRPIRTPSAVGSPPAARGCSGDEASLLEVCGDEVEGLEGDGGPLLEVRCCSKSAKAQIIASLRRPR